MNAIFIIDIIVVAVRIRQTRQAAVAPSHIAAAAEASRATLPVNEMSPKNTKQNRRKGSGKTQTGEGTSNSRRERPKN